MAQDCCYPQPESIRTVGDGIADYLTYGTLRNDDRRVAARHVAQPCGMDNAGAAGRRGRPGEEETRGGDAAGRIINAVQGDTDSMTGAAPASGHPIRTAAEPLEPRA
jgi:hypothetical protein